MKKTIFILILFTLLTCLTGNAMAESFTLHSKVTFGMTPDEVESCEMEAGFSLSDKEKNYGSSNVKLAKMVEGTIAGIENSVIHYFFDSENKLYSVTYRLGSELSSTMSEFETIDAALTKKYGAPNDIYLPIVDRIGFEPIQYLSSWGLALKKNAYPQYSSWLIQQDDGSYVVIVHYFLTGSIGYGLSVTFHIIGYQVYSADQISQELNNIDNEINQRNDDI